VQPGYKEYIILMKKWYDEGLLDRDVISNDWKSVDAKMLTGKSGAGRGAIGAKIGKYISLAREAGDMEFDLAAAQYPVKNKGDAPTNMSAADAYDSSSSAAITTKNKKVELTAKILDYFYGEEGATLKNFGVEGITYENVDGYPKYTELITKNPDGIAMAQAMGKYLRANVAAPGISNDERYLEQYYEFPQQKAALKVYNEYMPLQDQYKYPKEVSLTPEEANEIAAIMSDINTYKNEMFVKFFLGTVSLDKFESVYIKAIKDMKLDRVLQIQQDAYERYLLK